MKLRFPKSYVVYDFETTGLDTATCEVAEIAAIKVAGGKVVQEFSTLVKIRGEMHPDAARTHGITKEMCEKDGIEAKQAMIDLVAFIGEHPIMGHNIVRYDNIILARGIVDSGILSFASDWPNFAKSIDTAALYKGGKMGVTQLWNETHVEYADRILGERVPGLKYNLGAACADMGVDTSGLRAHRALADVTMCYRLFEKLIA